MSRDSEQRGDEMTLGGIGDSRTSWLAAMTSSNTLANAVILQTSRDDLSVQLPMPRKLASQQLRARDSRTPCWRNSIEHEFRVNCIGSRYAN